MYTAFHEAAEAPQRRTRSQNHPTLLFSWWCTICALVIILFRLFGRYIRTERWFAEDVIMAISIIPLLVRMGLIDVILIYGTNNVQTAGLTAEQIYHRSIGSRLVLASRIFYALYIWTVKFTILQFLQRLTASVWTQTYDRALRFLRLFFVVAFLAVVIATLSECQPFDHYWQVVPDPGARCRDGFAQVITMGAADIITDIALIALPLPIIVQSTMTAKRKLSLCLLFSLSGILIAITAYRIPAIINSHGRQQLRTLWASIEILAATAVANALVLGSFLRDRGIKKPKYKGIERLGSYDPQPSINRAMTKTHWGSDEDLFRTVGCRLDSVTESVETPGTHGVHSTRAPLPAPTYLGDAKDDELAIYSDLGGPSSAVREPSYFAYQPKVRNSVSPKSPPVDDRMMTFHRAHDFAHGDAYESGESSFILADEGGLLGSPRRATLASQGGLLAMSRKASEAFRRASPSPIGKRSSSARQDIPSSPMELQDIGGLLKDP